MPAKAASLRVVVTSTTAGGGNQMAEQRARTCVKQRRRPVFPHALAGEPHCVDPSLHDDQATTCDLAIDPVGADTGGEELVPAHPPGLDRGESSDRLVGRRRRNGNPTADSAVGLHFFGHDGHLDGR